MSDSKTMTHVTACLVVLVLGSVAPADAQEPAWTIDVTSGYYVEAWELNGSTEHLAGIQAGIDGRLWRGVALRGEGVVLRVHQQGPETWLRGATLGMRARRGSPARVFLDIGAGVATAGESVPPTGTRFNYLLVLGGGIEVPWSSLHVTAGARWLHVSNNGRGGRARNPDIQSLGGFVGVGWRFSFD
jgi:hypothetical protein